MKEQNDYFERIRNASIEVNRNLSAEGARQAQFTLETMQIRVLDKHIGKKSLEKQKRQ